MKFLHIDPNWIDVDQLEFEVVERKGLGHPDTLADGLAEAVSTAYSKYCLQNFGAVLHHNVDKLYIGGGHFVRDFGFYRMFKTVKVLVNGRMSNTLYGKRFDIAAIQTGAVKDYLGWCLPHLDLEHQVKIEPNSTQHTLRDFWFTPRDLNDLPDHLQQTANDTALCVAHYPPSRCEELSYKLERHFWIDNGGDFVPRYSNVGQDIKVMVVRKRDKVDITICVPMLSLHTASLDDYYGMVETVENKLREYALIISANWKLEVSIAVNPALNGHKLYLLGIGSCIECGEEGLVGRGNSISGVISIMRPHSMEAAFGKNPVYHTGRVHGFLTYHLAKAIFEILGVSCSVYALTKNGQDLIPPDSLIIQLSRKVLRTDVEKVVLEHFLHVDYLRLLLENQLVR